MPKKLSKLFAILISPAGFWAILFSLLIGYFLAFWLFKLGFKSFEMDVFIRENIFPSISSYRYFLLTMFIGQISILLLYLRKLWAEQSNIVKLSLLPLVIFIFITLVNWDNIYFQYLKFFLFSANLTLLGYLFFPLGQKEINPKKARNLMILVIIFFAFLYGLLSILRHNHYGSHAYDLGLYSQMVYNYSRSALPDCSIRGLTNCWGDHFDPILLLISPLYWLWANPKVLLSLQALMLALSAWPLYLIARKKLASSLPAIFIALGYLFFIGIWKAVDFDFHPIVFFPALFLFAYHFLGNKRYFLYWLFFALALLVKEDIPVYLSFFSIYLIFFRKQYKIGSISLAVCLVWYILATKIIIPHFAVNGFEYFQFSSLGANSWDVLKNILTNPLHVWSVATDNPDKQKTILSLFGSFGYLPVFAPIYVILSLPMLAEQVLFDAYTHWQINFHYSVAIAPMLALSSVYGLSFLGKKLPLKNGVIWLSLLVVFSNLTFSLYEKSPVLNFFRRSFYQKEEWMTNIDEVIKTIPKNAEVVAQHNIVPHLSGRKLVSAYPVQRGNRLLEPEFYVFSIGGFTFPTANEANQVQLIRNFLSDNNYGLYSTYNDAFVFKKNYSNLELVKQANQYLTEHYDSFSSSK